MIALRKSAPPATSHHNSGLQEIPRLNAIVLDGCNTLWRNKVRRHTIQSCHARSTLLRPPTRSPPTLAPRWTSTLLALWHAPVVGSPPRPRALTALSVRFYRVGPRGRGATLWQAFEEAKEVDSSVQPAHSIGGCLHLPPVFHQQLKDTLAVRYRSEGTQRRLLEDSRSVR